MPRVSPRPWNDHEVETLKTLVGKKPMGAIGAALDRSRYEVRGYMRRNGLVGRGRGHPPWTDAQKAVQSASAAKAWHDGTTKWRRKS